MNDVSGYRSNSDLGTHVFVERSDEVQHRRWYATFLQYTPQGLSWYRVVCFFRSTNSTKRESLCSLIFSTSGLAAKIMSTHPRPFLNPHCESGRIPSAIRCSHSSMTLARSLPTTSRRLMPRQLSQAWRSPFFGMGTITASRQSLTTFCSSHTFCINSSSLSHSSVPPCTISSGSIPVLPPALPDLSLLRAESSSSTVGGGVKIPLCWQ